MDLWVGRMMVHIQGGKRAARRSSSVRQIHHLDNCMRLLMTPFSSEVCLASSSWLRPRCQTPSRQKDASFRGPLTPRSFRKVHDNQKHPGNTVAYLPTPPIHLTYLSRSLSALLILIPIMLAPQSRFRWEDFPHDSSPPPSHSTPP